MPAIRMKADRAEPRRMAGRLYAVSQGEGWTLVRDGYATWEYVPAAAAAQLLSAEREEVPEAAPPAPELAAEDEDA